LPVFWFTACGFQPVYGKKDGAVPKSLAGVSIEPVGRDRDSQLLKFALEDNLNPGGAVPVNPAYRLNASLTSTASPIGIARDGTVSRYNVHLYSQYKLIRNSDDAVVTTGNVRHVSSYNNVTGAYFSTYISEEDAVKRGIGELGEMYRQRLAPFLTAGYVAPPRKQPLPEEPLPLEEKTNKIPDENEVPTIRPVPKGNKGIFDSLL
jgi:hypothetical protein